MTWQLAGISIFTDDSDPFSSAYSLPRLYSISTVLSNVVMNSGVAMIPDYSRGPHRHFRIEGKHKVLGISILFHLLHLPTFTRARKFSQQLCSNLTTDPIHAVQWARSLHVPSPVATPTMIEEANLRLSVTFKLFCLPVHRYAAEVAIVV